MRLLALLVILIAIAAVPANSKWPFNKFKVGNWDGGAYTNDETGKFSGCTVSTSYKSGVVFLISVTPELRWSLGFAHENWKLVPGSKFQMDLTFDSSNIQVVNAFPLNKNLATVPMPDDSDVIRAFRSSHLMGLSALGSHYDFSLDGTSRVLPALVACVRNIAHPNNTASNSAPDQTRDAVKPAISDEVQREREKLLAAAAEEHSKCLTEQMKELVPYSEEVAETLSQVIVTKCADFEQKFISLGVAIYGSSKEDLEKLVNHAVEQRKRHIVADIVTFRAELAKLKAAQPNKPSAEQPIKPTDGRGI
jgi:hypothetical protein